MTKSSFRMVPSGWRGCALVFLVGLELSLAVSSRSYVSSQLTATGNILRQQASSWRDQRDPPDRRDEKRFAALDLETLRRGSLFAINVANSAATQFQLLRTDLAQLEAQNHLHNFDGLQSYFRFTFPDANVGWAWYADTYSEDGWYRLEIRIDEDAPFPDVVKARAAGFIEGNLQGGQMYRYWTNYRMNEYRGRGEEPSQELYDFFDEQYGWMTNKVEAVTGWSRDVLRGDRPPPLASAAAMSGDGSFERRYWTLVGLVAAQFEGLTAGFWASVPDPDRNMTWHELYALNALGDMYELNVVFPPKASNISTATAAEAGTVGGSSVLPSAQQRHYTPGHGEVGEYGYGELLDCSALIKIDTTDEDDGNGDGGRGRGGGSSDDDKEDNGGADGYDDNAVEGGNAVGDDIGREGGGDVSELRAAGVFPLGRRGQQHAAEAAGWARARALRDGGGGHAAAASTAATVSGGGRPARRVRKFFASHNTWRGYYDMVRTWKVYDLPWSSTGPLTVSSSPGLLSSKDDWYTTDTFVVMETTNGIYNKALYDLIQPKCVLMWQRVQVANFGARCGEDWVDLFGSHNSGTYNNQWMVLNVPLLEAGRTADVLWVLEQLPGTLVSRDVTQVLLDQGYWASYNVPYFPEIYNLTGYPHPSIYKTCPRAKIFSREQAHVSSRADMMALMRLNRYQEDPLSEGLPNAAIAARYDLPAVPDAEGNPRNWTQRAYGAVDAKIVDSESFRTRRTYVINGPTADDQPPFRWSAAPLFDAVHHDGLVDEFDFDWQAYQSVIIPPLRK